ncbi:hypothetical protein CA983_43920, partial [Streptomyces swartbergensis]
MPQLIVVSPPGSGTALLHQITTALGYTSRGTMSAAAGHTTAVAPGEVYPLLEAAYGRDKAVRLIQAHHQNQADTQLEDAYTTTVEILWRVWWRRLGQPVTAHTPLDPALEDRLARHSDESLLRLLPGRDAWYVTDLDLTRTDGGLLRHWAATGRPAIIYHHRDAGDRIISLVQNLSRGQVGTMPHHLIYQGILATLPTTDAKLTLALTDPDFPATRPATWLHHHPDVITVTHEDLAGPAYGGTTHARNAALTRLTTALGHPQETATALPDAPSGLPGLTVGAFKKHATPHHQQLLASHLSLPGPTHRPIP